MSKGEKRKLSEEEDQELIDINTNSEEERKTLSMAEVGNSLREISSPRPDAPINLPLLEPQPSPEPRPGFFEPITQNQVGGQNKRQKTS